MNELRPLDPEENRRKLAELSAKPWRGACPLCIGTLWCTDSEQEARDLVSSHIAEQHTVQPQIWMDHEPAVILVKAVQTCTACPSQWDAWDDQGRYWYLRYRGGHGSMGRGYDIDTADLTFTADDHGGEIGLEDFCARIGVLYAPGRASSVTAFEVAPPEPGATGRQET